MQIHQEMLDYAWLPQPRSGDTQGPGLENVLAPFSDKQTPNYDT